MSKIGKDEIIKVLIELFFEEFRHDGFVVMVDWIEAQGDYDANEFISAVHKLQTELALRD